MKEYDCLLKTFGKDQPLLLVNRLLPKKEAASFNSKAMNAIFNTIFMEEFKRI